jgi:hypothetical protein
LGHDNAPGAKPEADPYDLDALRLGQDFASLAGVRKLLTTVPVRKPSKEWFVRVHPEPDYRLSTAVLELREDREVYLVSQRLWAGLASEATFSPRLLVSAVNRQGVFFVWPIRLPGSDGKIDSWSQSASEAMNIAQGKWVRLSPNMGLGAYEISMAPELRADPVWPDLSFQEIIKIAFRDRMISDWDHPVLKRLRGEA